jgi:hypothetical protein
LIHTLAFETGFPDLSITFPEMGSLFERDMDTLAESVSVFSWSKPIAYPGARAARELELEIAPSLDRSREKLKVPSFPLRAIFSVAGGLNEL